MSRRATIMVEYEEPDARVLRIQPPCTPGCYCAFLCQTVTFLGRRLYVSYPDDERFHNIRSYHRTLHATASQAINIRNT
ncbi:MAG: hypothetical protein O7D86_08880 [Proteobacteria bacterium]|nr:hypothetical protein [Pseudomonadota bacterium]